MPAAVPAPASADGGALAASPEDTILIHTPLYTYGISTRGARLVTATLEKYESQVAGHTNQRVELMLPGSELLGLRVVVGADTLRLDEWQFTASTGDRSIDGPTPVEFTAVQGGVTVQLVYTFRPDDYQVGVEGTVTGVGPNGGLLLVGMGPGLANTEANLVENERSMGFVTKAQSTKFKSFQSLDTAQVATVSGPFEWVAVKSKYFVTALLAFEAGAQPIGGLAVRPEPQPGQKKADRAGIWASMLLPAEGGLRYTVYAGPMEYSRLAKVGHDFDDVNPYGWPGFRTIIRPVAVAVRWLLVWMHDDLHLAYGLVLVLFGILVRLVLWPLNQKAMRSRWRCRPSSRELKDHPGQVQGRSAAAAAGDVQALQGAQRQSAGRLLADAAPDAGAAGAVLRVPEHDRVPRASRSSGCRTCRARIRSTSSRSSWACRCSGSTRMGQRGMPPNPQMKMMMYVMPVMMTVLFLNFASGLNLYYAVRTWPACRSSGSSARSG